MPNIAQFYLDYNVTGAERKRLVRAISEYVGEDPVYLRAPSFDYQVDYFTISKNGVVSFDSRADSEEIEGLIEVLVQQGFVAQVSNLGLPEDEMETECISEPATASEPAPISRPEELLEAEPALPPAPMDTDTPVVVLELPHDSVSMDNLTKLLEAKGRLIKKALALDELPVEPRKDSIAFPWFTADLNNDAINARIHLITALCEMSKRQSRVTAVEKEVESEKYAFRCFLLRLGFIGQQYKQERKILLKNLTGNSSHK